MYLCIIDFYMLSLFSLSVVEEKSQRAFCLAIAALIGEGIYNFGELVRSCICIKVHVWFGDYPVFSERCVVCC